MENLIDAIKAEVSKDRTLGERILKDGTLLIGHVPHVAPEAFLHQIFPPLPIEKLCVLKEALGRDVPEVYAQFLTCCNGLKVFSDSMTLDGYRETYGRAGDESRQPYDLTIPNVAERPLSAPESWFFIGGYGWDGSLLAIDTASNRVFRSDKHNAGRLNEWANFETMLRRELRRIRTLFGPDGKQIDEELPTTP